MAFAAEFEHCTDRIVADGSKVRSCAARYAAPNGASIKHNRELAPAASSYAHDRPAMPDPITTVSHCTSMERTGASGAAATLIHSDFVCSSFAFMSGSLVREQTRGASVVPHHGSRVNAACVEMQPMPRINVIPPQLTSSHARSGQSSPCDFVPWRHK